MRVLFQMPYPGYLRIYGSTVRELSRRGHTVLLAYDSDKKREPEAAQVEALPGVEIVPPFAPEPSARAQHLRLGADYLRYLDPRFAGAEELRRRMDKFLPPRLDRLRRVRTLPGPIVPLVLRALAATERAIPADAGVRDRLRELAPDCVVVTPLVGRGASGVRQTETVKAARPLGVPVALAVTSWDHLTSKGVVHVPPHRVFLWNEAQRREAVELHGLDPATIEITGAQLFDHWFDRAPAVDREAFLGALGLPADRPMLLYVGSSPNITPVAREVAFVRDWLGQLRASRHAELRDASVVVRPHPGNVAGWAAADLSGLDGLAVSPRERPSIPMTAADEDHYHASLAHAAAVVGINTSAMIEAAIAGRAVHTLLTDEFAATQAGTLHFHLLVEEAAPCAVVGRTTSEHLDQLAATVRDPGARRAQLDRFVREFVRPRGLERRATDVLVDGIEALAPQQPRGGFALDIKADQFVREISAEKLERKLAKRRDAVASHAGGVERDQQHVSEVYEGHYAPSNAEYAASRDKRRDVFLVDGRPVHVDGWYTLKFHADLLISVLDQLDGAASVLEVGSGRGTNLFQLAARRPQLELSGIELTANGVQRSRELLADPPPQHLRLAGRDRLDGAHATFVCGSALEMPFPDDSFDVSFTCLVLEQLHHDHAEVLREMRRVTRRWCVFLEPFGDANDDTGRAYLSSLDYFRAESGSFARHGLEPVFFTTSIPQKAHFGTGLLVAKVAAPVATPLVS